MEIGSSNRDIVSLPKNNDVFRMLCHQSRNLCGLVSDRLDVHCVLPKEKLFFQNVRKMKNTMTLPSVQKAMVLLLGQTKRDLTRQC